MFPLRTGLATPCGYKTATDPDAASRFLPRRRSTAIADKQTSNPGATIRTGAIVNRFVTQSQSMGGQSRSHMIAEKVTVYPDNSPSFPNSTLPPVATIAPVQTRSPITK